MTTPMPVFRTPYDVRLRHGTGAYFTIEASDRKSSVDPSGTEIGLAPGTYRVKVHYQGPYNSPERVTLQLNGTTVLNTPTLESKRRTSSPTITIIIRDGEIGALRVFSTPRSSELTDTSGIASVSIMPSQRRQ